MVIYLAVAGLAFAEGRSRGEPRWRNLAVLVLVGLAAQLILERGVNTQTLLNGPRVFDLPLAVTALLMVVDLVGLPQPVARRVHLGLHSRHWEFDRRLYALTQEARGATRDPAPGNGRPGRELPAIIARISALRAPDEDWAGVRDGWAAAWQRYLDLLSKPPDAAAWEEALALQHDLIERTRLLRVHYRSDASRILGKGS